jgi:GntR family transcriptional regulator
MTIEAPGPVPKHRRLTELLRETIAEADVDTPMPSERELGARHGIARMTARKALEALVTEGALYRVHGTGTFVAAPKLPSLLVLSSFTEDMRSRGLRPGARVLSFEEVPAGAAAGWALGIPAEARVYRCCRLRTADGVPMALETTRIPCDIARGLSGYDLTDASLYEVLATGYGICLDGGEQTVEAALAGPEEAKLLDMTPGAPVLALTRTATARLRPAEYVTDRLAGGFPVAQRVHRVAQASGSSSGAAGLLDPTGPLLAVGVGQAIEERASTGIGSKPLVKGGRNAADPSRSRVDDDVHGHLVTGADAGFGASEELSDDRARTLAWPIPRAATAPPASGVVGRAWLTRPAGRLRDLRTP